jgi:hypothetical protein
MTIGTSEIIIKPIASTSLVVRNRIEPLKFLFATITLTPPYIGVGP